MIDRFLAQLSDSHFRRRSYVALSLALYLLALGLVSLKEDFDFVVSDGRGYYAYLSSLVIDGDLDFENQIQNHWGADFTPELLETKTPLGRVANKYSIGLSLTLAPSFLLAHVSTLAMHAIIPSPQFAPDGYSLLYQLFNLAILLGLGTTTLWLIDRMLVEHFATQPRAAFFGVLLYWLGSNYAYYYFREPFMIHLSSAFWVTLVVFLSLESKPGRGPTAASGLVFVGFAAAMAVVCRPTNALLVLPFLIPALFAPRWARRLSLLALGALPPIVLQLVTWKLLWGSWLRYGYDSEGFVYWSSPYLWSTLFSSKQGLFFWSPILLLSVWGLVVAWREGSAERRWLLVRFAVGFVLLWYLNSSWHIWSFGDAFGGRAFLELSALFTFGLAWCVEGAAGLTMPRRWAVWGLIALSVAHSYVMMALYIAHRIPRSGYLF